MEPSRGLVEAWRKQALSDLRNARRNAEFGAHDVCVLLCQQAAEKMLKAAYMAVNGQMAPFTHNLAMLQRELGASTEAIGAAAELTADYITSRYPPDGSEAAVDRYDAELSRDRLERAQRVVEWAEEVLDGALSHGSG